MNRLMYPETEEPTWEPPTDARCKDQFSTGGGALEADAVQHS
jgi:hypothetical protein